MENSIFCTGVGDWMWDYDIHVVPNDTVDIAKVFLEGSDYSDREWPIELGEFSMTKDTNILFETCKIMMDSYEHQIEQSDKKPSDRGVGIKPDHYRTDLNVE